MRSLVALAAVSSAALIANGCVHSAYGRSGDERLEEETSGKTSSEGAADVGTLRCNDLQTRWRDAKGEDKAEGDRLVALTDIFAAAKERSTKIDDAVAKNPDLLYTADGEAIKAAQDECRSIFADVRSDLDRYVREITDMLVIRDIQGNKTVEVARLDFTLVRNAIAALDPDDKDVLNGKIDNAEKKIGAPKTTPTAKPGKGKGK